MQEPLEGVPAAVRGVLEALEAAGHPSFVVGGGVRDLLCRRPPGDFDVATAASVEQILELFPRAIPVGARYGHVMLPTVGGPIDVTSFREGATIETDLAHRDFTINAMAWHPASAELLDPCDGRGDLAKGRLRAVGDADARFAEDPLRALRGARLAAQLGLDVDAELARAMGRAIPGLARVARERVRHELAQLLLAPGVAEALALLRSTGLEQALAPGAAADAPAVVAALPGRLELRLAGWLRGTRPTPILRRLRFSHRTTERVERLLRWHPVDADVDASRDVSVRRHLKRVGPQHIEDLIALRRAELEHGKPLDAGGGRERLAALETALARVQRAGRLALQRQDLAIDGQAVMQHLGRGPGPEVGRALAWLTEQVLDDPARNTPEILRQLLDSYAANTREGDGRS